MRRYNSYLEDPNKQMPKSSKYRKRRDSDESTSTEDSQRIFDQETLNSESTESSNDRDIPHISQQESEEEPDVVAENQSMEGQQLTESSSDQRNSLSSQQTSDATLQNVMSLDNAQIGLQSSEDDSFQDLWIREAQQEFFEDSDGDDFSSDDSFYDELPNIEDVSIEEQFSFTKLNSFLQKDDNNESINAHLVVSKAEMLLAVLKLGLNYDLSQATIADIFKMLNCFFGFPLLPETRYLIDQMFNSKCGIEYHATCPNCKKYVGNFDRQDSHIKCNLCDTNIALKHPNYNEYFAMVNIQNEMINLIETNAAYYDRIVSERRENVENYSDITDGELYKKFVSSLPPEQRKSYVTTTFNSDGSPVFESSKCSIWPIQMIINELPYHTRTAKPIVCGMWFGKNKPDMNIFLDQYVNKLVKLSNDGIQCKINNEQRNIKVYALCCCVDSVARAPMQGVTQFNGHFGCSWCLHPGVYIRGRTGGSIKYTLMDQAIENRTERGTLQHMQETITSANPIYGMKTTSPLIRLPGFNIVRGFVPCTMHCIAEGVTKQFLNYWMNSTNEPFSLNNHDIAKINNLILSIKAPNQIVRLSRPVNERNWWKAREWENWTLYYSVPILLCFPHMVEYLKHWILLVEAFYILLKRNITRTEIDRADFLLKRFVIMTQLHYGESAMTYNVHQLQHLSQSVADWGPLWAHTGYCFESGNGRIVRQIHSAKGVVHQLCRSIAMAQSELILKNHIALKPDSTITNFVAYLDKKQAKTSFKIANVRYFGPNYKTKNRLIEELELSQQSRSFRKIVKERCLYTSCKNRRLRSDNSVAITNDGRFIRLREFILDLPTRKEYSLYSEIYTENILDSESLCIRRVTRFSNEMKTIDTNHIDSVCVTVATDIAEYICTVPNLYYY